MKSEGIAVELTAEDRAWLNGERGEGAALAMRLVVKMAEIARAPRLRDVTQAHIDSCLYHGQAGLDFAERLLAGGAAVSVPATLNVSSLDLLHPELVRLDDETRDRAKRLMDAYVRMGCRPTWTCAPYQLPDRPAFGEHVAWAESNAIVFANSVLGARTNRYGDFIDICAAITGRVPDTGLHTDEGRRATLLLRLHGDPGKAPRPRSPLPGARASARPPGRPRRGRRSRAFRRTRRRIASRPWAPRRRAPGRSRCSTRSA